MNQNKINKMKQNRRLTGRRQEKNINGGPNNKCLKCKKKNNKNDKKKACNMSTAKKKNVIQVKQKRKPTAHPLPKCMPKKATNFFTDFLVTIFSKKTRINNCWDEVQNLYGDAIFVCHYAFEDKMSSELNLYVMNIFFYIKRG